MSSIHSQASDTLPPQPPKIQDSEPQFLQQQQQQQQHYRVKTPAILEEEEDAEEDDTTNNNNNSDRVSPVKTESTPSSSSSNGNVKSISTITFEKQKVAPPRARTHSAQSVLSAISFQQHGLQPQPQSTQHNDEHRNLSSVNLASINQQIQSPAMSSIRKKGIANSVTSGKTSDEELEIGLRMPFTDDKRLYLDANSVKLRQQQRQKQQQRRENNVSLTTAAGSTVDEEGDDVDEDDTAMQRRLTTHALRKLSHLRGNAAARGMMKICGDGDGRTIDENTQDQEAMTHLKFGNKKVFLDCFPQGSAQQPNGTPAQAFRKASLEVIQQPKAPNQPNPSTRRSFKQIGSPKKPLYVPAVLRDVSETNITNEDMVRPSSPQLSLLSNSQTVTSRNGNSTSSGAASVHSNNSSMVDTCRRQFALLFFPNSEYASMESRWRNMLDTPAPPTKQHWLLDSRRSSCHYCHKLFTFWERKHHCRHCGDLFCQQHLGHWLYLNSDASFIIGGGGMGTLSKICDGCLEEYENVVRNPKWKSQKFGDAVRDVEPPRSIATGSNGLRSQAGETKDGVIGSGAGSIPADWNWSSF